MARRRKVTVVRGTASFTGAHSIEVESAGSRQRISFEQAILAAGSEPIRLPFVPHDDPRVVDSTGALALTTVPTRFLILGGGVIGLEMATIYQALGSQVTVVELADQIIPGADRDLVAPLRKMMTKAGVTFHLQTRLTRLDAQEHALVAHVEGPGGTRTEDFDMALIAVGRRPNGRLLNVEATGISLAPDGSVPVDAQMRTRVPHLFAIGDVAGQPMLAHKATHEAKVAAEAACGHKVAMQARVIPAVAYTDPEVAWVGLTELEAKRLGTPVEKAIFPWAASGRSLALGRDEGFTKLLFDPATNKLLGAGIVGPGAGELIAEAALAIEMGADAEDISLTIHAHPTLSETLGLAAEVFTGAITDLPRTKRKNVVIKPALEVA